MCVKAKKVAPKEGERQLVCLGKHKCVSGCGDEREEDEMKNVQEMSNCRIITGEEE